MSATAKQVLDSARTHLDDDEGALWTDPRLFPKLQEAHRELQLRMVLGGVPVINEVTSTPLTVPAYTTDFSTVSGYPTDLVEPIWMKERTPGQTNQDFVDMTECDFIPNENQGPYLSWWCWQGEVILFLGSFSARQVQLRYRRGIPIPSKVTDHIGILFGELFLSYQVAALTQLGTVRGKILSDRATANLETIVRAATKEAQNLPAKRQPYHRGRAARFIGPSMIGGGGGSGTTEVELVISGSQTGTDGTDGNAFFTISQTPSFLKLYKNGLKLKEGLSYTWSGVNIAFISPQIPLVDDVLEAIGDV